MSIFSNVSLAFVISKQLVPNMSPTEALAKHLGRAINEYKKSGPTCPSSTGIRYRTSVHQIDYISPFDIAHILGIRIYCTGLPPGLALTGKQKRKAKKGQSSNDAAFSSFHFCHDFGRPSIRDAVIRAWSARDAVPVQSRTIHEDNGVILKEKSGKPRHGAIARAFFTLSVSPGQWSFPKVGFLEVCGAKWNARTLFP